MIDMMLWHAVQRLVYPGRWPSNHPPFPHPQVSVKRKVASWLYYTLLDSPELRAKVIQ